MTLLLEAPVFTIEAGLKAAEYGVDRLELCADFHEGGTTPSVGALNYLKSRVDIPIFVMIRPRGGDFVYTKDELAVMAGDIHFLRKQGADGFVFGNLSAEGEVDMEACRRLLDLADGLPCTFHRAIDASNNIEKSLEKVIACGFNRVLTSGGRQDVRTGLNIIQKLLTVFSDRIVIMPGGGMTPELIAPLQTTGYLKEIHASCKTWRKSESLYWNEHLSLNQSGDKISKVLTISKEEVGRFKQECKP